MEMGGTIVERGRTVGVLTILSEKFAYLRNKSAFSGEMTMISCLCSCNLCDIWMIAGFFPVCEINMESDFFFVCGNVSM